MHCSPSIGVLKRIGLYLVVFAGAAVGLLSSLYIVVSLVWTIAYKIYRKIKFGVSIYN